MRIELRIPEVGESVTEVEIGGWLKNQGERVEKDEPIVTLESEKATVDLPAPDAGTLAEVVKQKGDTARPGEVIGYLEKDGKAEKAAEAPASGKKKSPKPAARETSPAKGKPAAAPEAEPEAEEERTTAPLAGEKEEVEEEKGAEVGDREAAGSPKEKRKAQPQQEQETEPRVLPAARRVLAEEGLRTEDVPATGPGGRLLKEDVLRRTGELREEPLVPSVPPEREEEVVPMTRLRRTIAQRLVEAQHTAALLTTFNEIDMSPVQALRQEHGETFQKRYNIKLGFMSFFVKACVDALKLFPVLNAEVRGKDVVYHNYCDIGIAIGGGKGLVVPVLRNAERLSFAEIESAIADFARRAQENKLKVEELQGGTFTISNGGVYGSLLSTPIVNPPQSGILGMHAIQDRPVAHEGNVVVRPMMYVALTYDHRIVDGREAVTFLKRIKEVIEDPARMLMEV